jgi:hypothetical protein
MAFGPESQAGLSKRIFGRAGDGLNRKGKDLILKDRLQLDDQSLQ